MRNLMTSVGAKSQPVVATASRSRINPDHLGYVDVEGLRYEDFLPISAAGIFASNLNQYGTKSFASSKPVYTQARLEEILDRKILDSRVTCAAIEAESLLQTYSQLGMLGQLSHTDREAWENDRRKLVEVGQLERRSGSKSEP